MTQLIKDIPAPTTASAADAPAWEQIGTCISGATSGPDVMRLAKLDWQVVQWPIAAVSPKAASDPTIASPSAMPATAARPARGHRLTGPGACRRSSMRSAIASRM